MSVETSSSGPSEGRRFHLKAKLGEGAYGQVFLAEMESSGGFRRRVALKLLHRDLGAHGREAERRMRDEARILGRLAHRHIVAVLDLVRLDNRWAVVMDYVPGADLEHVLAACATTGQAVPAPAALAIMVAVLRALQAAHETVDDDGEPLRVVHRDIKPSNVRLSSDGDVRVLDFGVARFSLDTREAETRARGWIGTELYMSPERILCEGDTPAGDVYAAGATLIELLTGEPLGRTPVLEDRHVILVDDAMADIERRLGGPEAGRKAVVDLIERLVAAKPEARPSAGEAALALEGWVHALEGESLAAFARRVVPQAEARTAGSEATTEGVLVERVSGSPTLHTGGATGSGRRGQWSVLLAGGLVSAVALGFAGLGGIVVATLLLLGVVPLPGGGDEGRAEANPQAALAVPLPQPLSAPAPDRQELGPAADTPTAPAPAASGRGVARPTPPDPPARAAAAAPPAAQPPGPRVEKAQFTLPDASGLVVTCGDRAVRGTSSLRITDFPAGPCKIEGTFLGRVHRAEISVQDARTVRCVVGDDGVMSCS